MRTGQLPHVVVVGGGFAGLAAANELAGLPLRTTLVDARYYNTFQPLLYQVATGGLNPGDVAYPLRGLLRTRPRLDFVSRARAEAVDFAGKSVRLAESTGVAGGGTDDPQASFSLDYDFLILATGAATNYFGIPGAEEHGRPIYTLDDALGVRSHMFAQLEHANAVRAASAAGLAGAARDESSLADGPLTVVVVGGGATGVETAGALAELRAMALASTYRSLDPSMSRVVLVERADRLLAAFAPRLGEYAARQLRRRGVELRLGLSVQEVAETHVDLRDERTCKNERLGCGLVVWAAGVGPAPLTRSLDVALGPGGRVQVDKCLAIPGCDGAYAIGDLAAAAGGGGDTRPLPQLAQPAIQGGRHAARQVARALEGLEPEEFCYKDKGAMATIGRRSAVAEVRLPLVPGPPLRLRGTLAWLAWLGLHVVTLLGGRNRGAVLLNWAWRYLAWGRGPRVIVGG